MQGVIDAAESSGRSRPSGPARARPWKTAGRRPPGAPVVPVWNCSERFSKLSHLSASARLAGASPRVTSSSWHAGARSNRCVFLERASAGSSAGHYPAGREVAQVEPIGHEHGLDGLPRESRKKTAARRRRKRARPSSGGAARNGAVLGQASGPVRAGCRRPPDARRLRQGRSRPS